MNYLNEFDPQAAAWLRELRDNKLIPPCDIDTRSIEDVEPRELAGYTQCHFFAGIGGWPLALQLAGWPADRPIWTGSCPCQPFSAAGKGNGFDDERHLWPAFHWLIEQCRPAVVLGEQVASAAVNPWIDLVLTDLEALGYASGAYAGPAAGVGAPHIRDRSYWVGYAHHARPQGYARHDGAAGGQGSERPVAPAGVFGGLADTNSQCRDGCRYPRSTRRDECADCSSVGGLADADGGHSGPEGLQRCGQHGQQPEDGRALYVDGASATNGHWRAADWLGCRDGKWRPVEPGTFPLAHGLPGRVGRLRGYGNAIVPQQAAEFVKAVMAYDARNL